MGYVIGCDVGSQSAKAVVLNEDGAVIASSGSPYTMIHLRDGWADQDPARYREALARAINDVLDIANIPGDEVTHITMSTQVDGVVPIDDQQRPLRNAIIWMDRRAVEQTRRLQAAIDPDRAFELTGLNLDATHTAPKMMWIADHEPDRYRAAASLPSIGGYIVAWMTGRSIQDHANSSTSLLYDIRTRDWNDELIDAAGLDRAKLPEIANAHEPAGTLLPQVAAELGLSAKCVVLVGTGDEHAACIGAGGVRPGVVVDIIGTAEPVGVASEELLFDETRLVETHAHAMPDMYFIENPGFVSGGNTLWLSNLLGVRQGDLFDLAAQSVPGARGVRFIPALSGAMAPRWRESVRGSFTGLGMNHGAPDMARAVIEANVFAFHDIYDRLRTMGLADSVRMVGGGSRSDLWGVTKATLCQTSIDTVTSEETCAVGAAMLSGIGAGYFEEADDAVARVVELSPDPIQGDAADYGVLEDAYQDYRAVFDALEPLYERRTK